MSESKDLFLTRDLCVIPITMQDCGVATRHDTTRLADIQHPSKFPVTIPKKEPQQHLSQQQKTAKNMAPHQHLRKYHDNVLAQVSAAVAREQCITLIRQHLHNHLQENPNTSYESWIASCHPENVRGNEIDKRFRTKENNPWREIWEHQMIIHQGQTPSRNKNKVDQFVDDFLVKLFR
jgi:hypothetical protein